MKDFRDKVAVITGGASGIGFATAKRCAAEGMRIVLADVEQSSLDEACEALSADGAQVMGVRTDVSSADQVDALARSTIDRFGGVHLLFNNAGVAVTGALWECSLDDLRWSIDVNLWGVIHGIRSFVPILLEQGEPGHVVNTASMAGVTTAPYLDIYTATKHAVMALSESLYKELQMLQSPVSASVVCPGLIKTRIMQSERNRPGDPTQDPDRPEPSAGAAMMASFLTQGTTTDGWSPEVVADAILAGVREQRLYIIPAQDELKAGMIARLDDLRHERNPELGVPESTA